MLKYKESLDKAILSNDKTIVSVGFVDIIQPVVNAKNVAEVLRVGSMTDPVSLEREGSSKEEYRAICLCRQITFMTF